MTSTQAILRGDVVVKKPVLSDRRVIWEWRHDATTLKLNDSRADVTYAIHRAWYDFITGSEKTVLLIALAENLRIGLVRFDLTADHVYEVNVYLKPLYCGKGYLSTLLGKGVSFLKDIKRVDRVVADIENTNPSTVKIFEEAGFQVVDRGARLECSWTP